MRKRYFIVNKGNEEYMLKEIDSTIAKAVAVFGPIKGEAIIKDDSYNFFYFFLVHPDEAKKIAEELCIELLENEATEKPISIDKSEIDQGREKRM